jgi:hypothetical protein
MMSFKNMRSQLIAMAIVVLSTDAFAQTNLLEWVRQQARRDPNGTIQLPAPPGHYDAKPLEDLERESAVVLTGKLRRKSSYLGLKEDRVHTDYNITEVTVISGRLTLPAESISGEKVWPIVTVWGGETVVEGIRVRAIDRNFDAIEDGGDYLVFLRAARQSPIARYEIYDGAIFEIGAQYVTPLLKHGDDIFAWARELPMSELIAKIRASGKAQ